MHGRLPLQRDLRLQLLALYLLFVAPVIGAALLFDALGGARLRHDVKAADLALAQSIALETNASLQNALNTVVLLSPAPGVQALDTSRLLPLIATARREVNLVYVLDANGMMPITAKTDIAEPIEPMRCPGHRLRCLPYP